MIKQQIEEKITAVSVLRSTPGIDQSLVHGVEAILASVMKQCSTREHRLQHSTQLVCVTVLMSVSSRMFLTMILISYFQNDARVYNVFFIFPTF